MQEAVTAALGDARIREVGIEDREGQMVVSMTLEYPENLESSQIRVLEGILSEKIGQAVVSQITVVPVVRYWEINN